MVARLTGAKLTSPASGPARSPHPGMNVRTSLNAAKSIP